MLNTRGPLSSKWMQGNLIMYPQAIGPGKEYCVDKNTGSDSNSGFDWGHAKLTVAGAITASNLTCGNYNMNTIYVNAQTYTESLTVLPKNANIIAVGARTRITGHHVIASSSTNNQNTHFWNFWFRGSGAYPTFDITAGAYYTLGFHGCTFEGAADVTCNLKIGNILGTTIEDCRFEGNPLVPTAIWTVDQNIRMTIRRNYIEATTNGILIDTGDNGYGNIICDNIIGRIFGDANNSIQMTYGICMLKADGASKYQIVNNRIEALDAIYTASIGDTRLPNQCIGNICNEAGVSAFEDTVATD